MHHHTDIRRYAYREVVNGRKKSNEVFCMTEDQLHRALNISMRNRQEFVPTSKRDREDCSSSIPVFRRLCEKVGMDLNDDVDANGVDYANKRGRCTLIGPRIQAYSADGHELVRTFHTLLDAVRDNSSEGASQSAILTACDKKIVKYGHRWAKLERSSADSTVQQIGDTVELVNIRTGLVAAMSDDKSEVLKIYTSFKACGAQNGFKSAGATQKVMKRGGKVGGHHIMPWSDLQEHVQDKWLQNNTLPTLKRNATCKKIERLDPVGMHFKIGQRALRSAISGDLVKQGFRWAYALEQK